MHKKSSCPALPSMPFPLFRGGCTFEWAALFFLSLGRVEKKGSRASAWSLLPLLMSETDRIIRELLDHERVLDRARRLRKKERISQTEDQTTDTPSGQESAPTRDNCAIVYLVVDALRSFSLYAPWWDEDDRVIKHPSRYEEEEQQQRQHTSQSPHRPLARRSCQSLTNLGDH